MNNIYPFFLWFTSRSDYYFNDFSTIYATSLEEYIYASWTQPEDKVFELYAQIYSLLYQSILWILKWGKYSFIAIFPSFDFYFHKYYPSFCNYVYYYFTFFIMPFSIKYFWIIYSILLVIYNFFHFIFVDLIIIILFFIIDTFSAFYSKYETYFVLWLFMFKIVYYFFFVSTASYWDYLCWCSAFYWSYASTTFVYPFIVDPVSFAALFWYDNWWLIIKEFSFFIFQPTFYKLSFYYWWWCCPGILPDQIIVFFTSYVFPVFFFVFPFVSFFFEFFHWASIALCIIPVWPYYFLVIIFYIVKCLLKIFLFINLPFELFFSLFGTSMFPFNLLYHFYNCSAIFMSDYLLYSTVFYLLIFLKSLLTVLIFSVQIFLFLYLHILHYFVKMLHIYGIDAEYMKSIFLTLISFIVLLFKTLIFFILQIYNGTNIKTFVSICTFLIDVSPGYLKSLFISVVYICFVVKNFFIHFYGGIYIFKYPFLCSLAVHISSIVFVSCKKGNPVTGSLAYLITNRLCIVYLAFFLPALLVRYCRYLCSTQEFVVDFFEDVLLYRGNYELGINICLCILFLCLSWILRVFNLRDNVVFLFLNFLVFVYVLGVFYFVRGFNLLEHIYVNFHISTWIFVGSDDNYSVLEYWDFAPYWMFVSMIVLYVSIYIYYIYLTYRLIISIPKIFYGCVDTYRLVMRDHHTDFWGVRYLEELSFFDHFNENLRSSIYREVQSRTGLDEGLGIQDLFDEWSFVHELYNTAYSRLVLHYTVQIEKHITDNLDPNKIWYPHCSEFEKIKLMELSDKDLEYYSSKLKDIDHKEFLGWDKYVLFSFFDIRVDDNIVAKVQFYDVTITGQRLNPSDTLLTWERSFNAALLTTYFKIIGNYDRVIFQQFSHDHFLHITYCIHVMKILKGEIRIWGDWSKMKFYFTRYFHLMPDEFGVYSPFNNYDEFFPMLFSEDFYTVDFDYETYRRYVWREGDTRTVLDYLGYFEKPKEFFFLTIFYRESPAVHSGFINEPLAPTRSLTAFLNDEFTSIDYSHLPADFTMEATAPTTQEFEDPDIFLRQWGYDYKLVPRDTFDNKTEHMMEQFQYGLDYAWFFFAQRRVAKKINVVWPHLNCRLSSRQKSTITQVLSRIPIDNLMVDLYQKDEFGNLNYKPSKCTPDILARVNDVIKSQEIEPMDL